MADHAARAKRPVWKTILRVLGACVAVVLLCVGGLIAFLTFTEYRPANLENIEPSGNATRSLAPERELTLLTWNVGYGALDETADFFMDGGTHVRTADKTRVASNMESIATEAAALAPDIALFQEVDTNSDRSARIDQAALLTQAFDGMQAFFATNYKTEFVPLGIPPYGKIDGGLLTLTSFAASATRSALPLSYSWPMSTVQLKRCELIMRIPVEGSSHELVLINEHPDAYTDEEHHATQMAAIRATLEKEAAAGNWVIAGGDWNHIFSKVDTSSYPVLDESKWMPGYLNEDDFGPDWQFVMDSTHPTCRLLDHALVNADGTPSAEPMQYYMLDGFIMTNNVELVSIETHDLKFKASDHNPVVMKVLLKND